MRLFRKWRRLTTMAALMFVFHRTVMILKQRLRGYDTNEDVQALAGDANCSTGPALTMTHRVVPVIMTDKPRNQSMFDTNATRWDEVLPAYKANSTMPSDRLWMPILGSGGGFVYSAFLDKRLVDNSNDDATVIRRNEDADTSAIRNSSSLLVRVIGYVPKGSTEFYCKFHFGNDANFSRIRLLEDPKAAWNEYHVTRAASVKTMLFAFYPKYTMPEAVLRMFPYCPPVYARIPDMLEVLITCPLQQSPIVTAVGKKLIPSSVSIVHVRADGDIDTASSRRLERTCNKELETEAAGNNLYLNRPKNHKRGAPPQKFAFCFKALRAVYSNALGLLEVIEFHSLLSGHDAVFHFYGISYTKEVECLLSTYYGGLNNDTDTDTSSSTDNSRIRIIRRKVYFHNNEMPPTRYDREPHDIDDMLVISLWNDCLYRNLMEGIPYVAFLDVDELIVPNPQVFLRPSAVAAHDDDDDESPLLNLMNYLTREHPRVSAFQFKRPNFPLQWPDGRHIAPDLVNNLLLLSSSSPSLPVISRLRSTAKVLTRTDLRGCQKLMVLADRAETVNTHWISAIKKEYEYSYVADPTREADVHHYRREKLDRADRRDMMGYCNKSEIDLGALVYWRLWAGRFRAAVKDVGDKCGPNWMNNEGRNNSSTLFDVKPWVNCTEWNH